MTDKNDAADSTDSEGLRRIVPSFIRRSLALKLAIVLLLMGVVVGVAGGYGTMQIESEFKQDVNNDFASNAERGAEDVSQWHERNVAFVELVSRSGGVQLNNVSIIQEQFSSGYLGLSEQFARDSAHSPDIHYIDTDTNSVLASSEWSIVGTNVSDLPSPVRNNLEAGETRVTGAFNWSDRVGREVSAIAYVTTVPRQSNRKIVFMVPLDGISSELDLGPETHTSVVDSSGRLLMTDDGTNLLATYPNSDGMLEGTRNLSEGGATVRTEGSVQDPVAGIESSSLAGEEYVAGYSRVPGTNWTVVVHANAQETYGPVVTAAQDGFIATLVGVLFIIVAGAVVGRSLTGSIDEITSKTRAMQNGDLDVDISSGRIDAIGQLHEGLDDMRRSLKAQIQEAESARKEAEVSRAEAVEMNRYLQDTADEYAEIMQRCAAGDLTRRMEQDGENDAMDRIAEEFNAMIDELEKTTGQLKSFADEVEAAGEAVNSSAVTVREASEEVAESVQRISDDAFEQQERLEGIAGEIDEIAADLEAFAEQNDVDVGDSLNRIGDIATVLNRLVEMSEEMMNEAETVAGAAEEQSAELTEVSEQAQDLSRYASPLREVLARFATESEHEFYFPTGPGSGEAAVGEDD